MHPIDLPPCLIIGYLRLENIGLLIDTLVSVGVKTIYLNLDKSRNEIGYQKQLQFISKLQSKYESGNFKLLVRLGSENRGAAVSVLSSIDWIASQEEKFIVLEDDLKISTDFLFFSRFMLEKLSADKNVLLVSGNRFFASENPTPNTIFTIQPLIWGWATWSYKWMAFREALESRKSKKISPSSVHGFLKAGHKRAHKGLIDSWDLPLANFMLENKMICALPPSNIVSNFGADENALHTKTNVWPLNMPITNLNFSQIEASRIKVERNVLEERLINLRIYGVKRHHIFSALLSNVKDSFKQTPLLFNMNLVARLNKKSDFYSFEIGNKR